MKQKLHQVTMLLLTLCVSTATLFAQHVPDTIYVQFLNTVNIEAEFVEPLHTSDAKIKNVDEILTNLSGVHLIRRGNYASEVYYRGVDDSRVKSSIDGMRIFSACTDKMDPITSYVESVNLESGSVQGNTQGKHNACGTGGSLGLETKKAGLSDSLEIEGSLITNYKSVSNGKEVLFNTGIKSQSFGLRINGSMRRHENYTAGGGVIRSLKPFSILELFGGKDTSISFKLKWTLSVLDTRKENRITSDSICTGSPSSSFELTACNCFVRWQLP